MSKSEYKRQNVQYGKPVLEGVKIERVGGPKGIPIADNGPWTAVDDGPTKLYLESDDFTHDVRLYINGDFRDRIQAFEYAKWLANELNQNYAEDE